MLSIRCSCVGKQLFVFVTYWVLTTPWTDDVLCCCKEPEDGIFISKHVVFSVFILTFEWFDECQCPSYTIKIIQYVPTQPLNGSPE